MERSEDLKRIDDKVYDKGKVEHQLTSNYIDFENGVIIAKFYTDSFIFVNFDKKLRCTIPLEEFEFENTKDKLEKLYVSQDSRLKDPFPDHLFVPLKKFRELDKVIYGKNGSVYVIRGYLSVSKNSQPAPDQDQRGEKSVIYKFDFTTFKVKIVYIFEDDLYQFTCQRFNISKDQQIDVANPYTDKKYKINENEGILIAAGKTQNKFIEESYFLCTNMKVDDDFEHMLVIFKRSFEVASPVSCIIKNKNIDYFVMHGGYTLSDFNKKLERKYISLNDFTTIYYDIDRTSMYKQKHSEIDDSFWNLKNYIMIPINKDIYVLGGVSKLEDTDMTLDHFSALRYECKFSGLEIHSIKLDCDFKPKKIRKTAIFEEDSTIDHCYLAHNQEEVKEIWSVCTLNDSNRLNAMIYNIESRKATFEDLTAEYKPIPFKYTTYSRLYEKYDVPETISLSSGISQEFLLMNF